MRNGSDNRNAELLERLEQMKGLLSEVIGLAGARKPARRSTRAERPATPTTVTVSKIDYSTNIRAFVRRYGAGMSGHKKFALLLAYLTKGDASKQIPLEEIEKQWNKMTAKSLLGMKFNRKYPTNAKEHDWVNTEKHGSYHLRPSWKEIFNDQRRPS